MFPIRDSTARSFRSHRLLGATVLCVATAAGYTFAPTDATVQWQLSRRVTVAAEGGRGPTLEQPGHIALAKNGNVYVVDYSIPHIVVYDSSGRYVRRIGARGSGPGEFQTISNIALRGDSLLAADRLQSRVTVYSAEGRLIGISRTNAPFDAQSRRPARLAGLLAGGIPLVVPDLIPWVPGTPVTVAVPILILRSGDIVDTLTTLREQPRMMRIQTPAGVRTIPLRAPRNVDRWAASPDGSFVVVARSIARDNVIVGYSIERISNAGELVFTRSYYHSPIPFPEAERERIHANTATDLTRVLQLSRPAAVRMARLTVNVASHRFAVSHIFISNDHRIWLTLWGRDDLLVLDGRTGAEIASAVLPANSVPRTGADAANGEMVWSVERDNLGVVQLSSYRIQGVTSANSK